MTRSPHVLHQTTCVKMATQLENWSDQTGNGVVIFAPSIIFTDADNVIPDLIWVSSERLEQVIDDAGHLTGAPELVVEVLSPDKDQERRDKQLKLKLYSAKGVHEYWIVDRQKQQIEVYRRDNAALTLVMTLYPSDTLTSPLLPGSSCLISCIFI